MHHEFFHLAKKILQNFENNDFALATVFQVKGSAYRREGTRMLIGSSGNWFGNISGGCLEGDILRKAKQVIKTGENLLVTYDTRESENKEIRVALGCNGVIDILIEPVNQSIFKFCEKVTEVFAQENTAYLTTQIQQIKDNIQVVRNISETVPNGFPSTTFENENFCEVEKSELKITLHEFIGLQRKLVIWGAGPDVFPLANFAKQLGWKTIVAADENLERIKTEIEGIETIKTYPENFLEQISVHENTAVILVSHDYYKDFFMLEKIIQKDVKYIGIMGPQRRGARMIQEITENYPEFSINENKVFYPIGLDIGSDNPVEIALSVISEVQSVFSGKNAAPLKQKTTRIHDSNSDDEIEEFNPTDSVCTVNYFQ